MTENEVLQLKEDIRAIAGSAQGQRFLRWFLSTTGLMQTVYTGNSDTYYNSGKRELGLLVWQYMLDAEVPWKVRMSILEEDK